MNLMIYFLLFSLLSFTPSTTPKNKWVVTGSSTLEILGSTNINKFRCLSTNYPGTDTLVESTNQEGLTILSGNIILKTSEFDCENNLITKDLKKTLKAEQYPEIKIKFHQLMVAEKRFYGMMEITIAGISKKYPINCSIQPTSSKKKSITGAKDFNLTDFRLDPPDKLFGAIRVANNVSVLFHLQLEAV